MVRSAGFIEPNTFYFATIKPKKSINIVYKPSSAPPPPNHTKWYIGSYSLWNFSLSISSFDNMLFVSFAVKYQQQEEKKKERLEF